MSDDRDPSNPRGWYGRGYLPHFDGGQLTQVVTFRLADSLPQNRVKHWKAELERYPAKEAKCRLVRQIERCLDTGLGSCHLREPRIARVVEESLLYFDRNRYDLHAWVIMPNHVHVLFTQLAGVCLEKILHSWKSFTAKKVNRVLRGNGRLWQRESHDRFIRDEAHFQKAVHYVEENPVVAGLCARKDEWEFSSAHGRFAGRWSEWRRE